MDFHGEQLVKHRRHPSKLLSNFLNKAKIFSDISLLRLGKNTSIALQNMTESPPLRKKKKKQTKKQKKNCPSIVKSLVLQGYKD